jgi:Tol biopolymer transport system component
MRGDIRRRFTVKQTVALAAALVLGTLALSASAASPASTTRVSVSSAGVQGDRDSYAAGISADGRYVLFNSVARNLVAGDTNDRNDVFLADRQTGSVQRVSVRSGGGQAQAGSDPWGGSFAGGMSSNARYIVFGSDSPNLVPHDTNRTSDVFVFDRARNVTTRVSVGIRGRQSNGPSSDPAISANGRYVAFSSLATNLVRGDTNRIGDVFVRDLRTGKTVRASVTSRGGQARCAQGCESTEPALSANGRFVAFQSSATNLVRGDTNRLGDVFVHDLRTGRTDRVSVSSSGRQAGGDRTNNGSNAPVISANGRIVAFHSYASNLVRGDTNGVPDIFVHDRRTGKTTRVSLSTAGNQANQETLGALSISADGHYVAFTSLASNLVAGDANDITDVFVRDLRAGTTSLVSLGASGNQGGDASSVSGTAFSADDRYLAFSSWAPDLVAGDTNIVPDAFVRDLHATQMH